MTAHARDFEAAVRKLGWLSSYARQALLSRHLLRSLQEYEVRDGLAWNTPDRYPLDCFRAVISALSGENKKTQTFSAPYAPSRSPDTCYLAFHRRERLFEVSIASGQPSIAFHNPNGEIGWENSMEGAIEDTVFIEETKWLGKGVSLFNKQVADDRVITLRNAKLFGETVQTAELDTDVLEWWYPEQPENTDFWKRWYKGFLLGVPLNWDLQRRVAQIGDATWDQGPRAVADAIKDIEAGIISERLPLAETLDFNPHTGRFFGKPQPIAKPSLLSATLHQVAEALNDTIENPANGLQDRDLEVRKINRMIERHGNDPQRIEMTCSAVGRSLLLKTAGSDAELPASDENVALIDALREAAQGIRGTHPDVAENRRILDEQVIDELPEEGRAQLADAQPILEEITEGYIHDDMVEDLPVLLAVGGAPQLGGAVRNPVLASYDEKRRVFGRVARIAIMLRKFPEIVHKIDGSAGYKAGRIVLTITGLVSLVILFF